ncbi:hypothetical protein Pmar_PMAR016269 [Perkinsus marinus ATCC 50983]|uniref:Uncharacterized protein n=1 Tax=Perkinsus marinus (strain ATCC 50983 / TXsc) TaxID=423536 RepID=C5KST1_PERM5|nr:hypothetical protein Pmar_PMAR016269 [Perkinsus marinus ATCC 50983]EER12462.1 hypothetical protein Pmar_PMAR016269 [Perkinsus marinus ATCC 50983]|eukprot:XP_002780667.1 hypothetical protein Pmar_PMAR016269 [Perkinsus marinus ATCC 50983]
MVKSFIRQAKSDNARLEAETARLAGEQECSIAQIKAMEAGAQLKEQQGKTDAIVKAPPPPPSSSPSSDVVELTSDSEASAREDPHCRSR